MADDRPMVSATGLTKSYDSVRVLRGVDFSVRTKEIVAIVGPSGSGKSTMLRCLALLEEIDSGQILLQGEEVGQRRGQRISERRLSRQRAPIGMVFQNFNLFPHLTVRENVVLPQRVVKKTGRQQADALAEAMLSHVGMASHAEKYPAELSGGQQQRVAIARALVMNPSLMLFDEPTSALDPELVREVLSTIELLAGEGMTMVIVTHELNFARHIADRMVFMDEGNILAQGAPDEFFGNSGHPRLQEFLNAMMA